jgi:hypothetical protein
MQYVFKFRRRLFWKSFSVIGHGYDSAQDKMALYLPGGAIREIKRWRDCEVSLGTDWVLAQKAAMEKQAGQSIPVSP